MQVMVRYFAGHRDITGQREETIELPDGATVGSLWDALTARDPRLEPYRRRLLFAVNEEYGTPETELHNGDEIAFIPPVSGGRSQAAGAA